MTAPSDIPIKPPQEPSAGASSNKYNRSNGLSLGATVGIGVGIALALILGAAGAWILVRRRRRVWAQKRREQGDPETDGDSPEEEIARKLEKGRVEDGLFKETGMTDAVEMDGGSQDRAELDVEKSRSDTKMLVEPRTEIKAFELASRTDEAEFRNGKTFVAELEGSGVGETSSRHDTTGAPTTHRTHPVGKPRATQC
jgi:hypothetical protein